jgi:hypothetical protein
MFVHKKKIIGTNFISVSMRLNMSTLYRFDESSCSFRLGNVSWYPGQTEKLTREQSTAGRLFNSDPIK